MIKFNNTYALLPEQFHRPARPKVFQGTKLLAFNTDLAKELDFDFKDVSNDKLAKIFSGQVILEGSTPLAMAYAGHQFGNFVSSLGDGRAMLLGEKDGFDIQLKGAGRTEFSRGGDGLSALGPVIREFILSEAMSSLGVPTTRALAAVISGDEVYRNNGPEPGGIFTRVASSHLRIGTFQYFAAKADLESLKILLEYSVSRHYPELLKLKGAERALAFIKNVAEAQAKLVSHWMSLGFIHGVMNTDNSSIAGITIDYGPCAFMDEFNFKKCFSSIDVQGRYCYENQGPLTQWNILRLAECLIPLIDSNNPDNAIKKIEETVSFLPKKIEEYYYNRFSKKLGLNNPDKELVDEFLSYMQEHSLDFTLSFRNLPDLFNRKEGFYPDSKKKDNFTRKWLPKTDITELSGVNPLYIPRNHQVQRVIEDVYSGDFTSFKEINLVLKNPFDEDSKLDKYKEPPTSDQRVCETFCGT